MVSGFSGRERYTTKRHPLQPLPLAPTSHPIPYRPPLATAPHSDMNTTLEDMSYLADQCDYVLAAIGNPRARVWVQD